MKQKYRSVEFFGRLTENTAWEASRDKVEATGAVEKTTIRERP